MYTLPFSSVLPVGTPFSVTLDHLMFGLVVSGLIVSLKAVLSVAEVYTSIRGAALVNCS